MEILHKVRSFKAWWRGLNCFGQKLPVVLAFALFVALGYYIYSEISGVECKEIGINRDAKLTAIKCGPDSFSIKKVIETIGSDTVRNLSLLLVASIGWFFLYWRASIADQGIAVEKFTRAVELLTHKKLHVRLGGILNLEKIALDKKEESKKIAYILASFIRTQATREFEKTEEDIAAHVDLDSKLETVFEYLAYRNLRLDIELAVYALASIALEIEKRGEFREEYEESKGHLCDLRHTDLRGLRLNRVDLSNFNLLGVDFSGAFLIKSNLSVVNSDSPFIFIESEEEDKIKFIGAFLEGANFSNMDLSQRDFSHSQLQKAIFDNAHLEHAVFDECRIGGAHFESSHGLTQEQIDKAWYFKYESPPFLPEGLKPPQPRSPQITMLDNGRDNNPPAG